MSSVPQVDPEMVPQALHAPPDYHPDFTTYYLRYPLGMREVVRLTIGASGDDGPAFVDRAIEALQGSDGPLTLERGRVLVPADPGAQILFAYWDDLEAHKRWSESEVARGLFDGAPSSPRWSETAFLPLTHTEAHFSLQTRETGLGRVPGSEHEFCPMVGYWGSGRDRIPVAARDPLEPGSSVPTPIATVAGDLFVEGPHNLCTIRTSQDWQGAPAEHLEWYRQEVEPVLRAGVEYLDREPIDSGCLSIRYIRETDLSGADTERTCVLAHFRSLGQLESWARDHPSHHAIFEAAMKMIRRFGDELGIRLFHEVSVLPAGRFQARYLGCADDAGILPG
ncbi:MAG: phenylacetaldoxime dehydratase family protein [Actinobacteria bacterium]|nr:phenylacetaldoxime dehydratase family protein [Actinomycetota bacterium]